MASHANRDKKARQLGDGVRVNQGAWNKKYMRMTLSVLGATALH